jgi:hypothetical protein
LQQARRYRNRGPAIAMAACAPAGGVDLPVMREIPEVWRRFASRAAPNAPDDARGSVIHQQGEIRFESGRWVPFTAEQWFDARRCGFCWHARARMAPFVTAVVEDAYEDGHGRLEAKLFGAIPVMRGDPGVDLDRGELVRYLGELAWNPQAILHNDELHFSTSPDRKPRVWARDEASYVDCTFDAAGDLVEIETLTRVRDLHGPQPWSGRFLAYGELGGARVPTRAEVSWDGPGARTVYWRGTVTGFEWAEALPTSCSST